MLATSSFAVLLSATVAMAGAHQSRNHNAIAKRVQTNNTFTFDKRETFANKPMTWYPTDTGPDACTGKNHLDSDWFVAMGYDQFGAGGCCGKQLKITYNGKSTVATCVDECASCPEWGQIDLTKDLFKFFTDGDLGIGEFYGSWTYADGSDDDEPTPKPTPTPTPTPTPKKTITTQKTTATPKVTPTTTVKKLIATSHATSSSVKPSSLVKPSSSSAKPSSASASVVKSTSATPSATPILTPTQAIANAGAGADTSDSSTVGTDGISGGITTGDSNGAASLSFNKLIVGVAAIALVAVQAL